MNHNDKCDIIGLQQDLIHYSTELKNGLSNLIYLSLVVRDGEVIGDCESSIGDFRDNIIMNSLKVENIVKTISRHHPYPPLDGDLELYKIITDAQREEFKYYFQARLINRLLNKRVIETTEYEIPLSLYKDNGNGNRLLFEFGSIANIVMNIQAERLHELISERLRNEVIKDHLDETGKKIREYFGEVKAELDANTKTRFEIVRETLEELLDEILAKTAPDLRISLRSSKEMKVEMAERKEPGEKIRLLVDVYNQYVKRGLDLLEDAINEVNEHYLNDIAFRFGFWVQSKEGINRFHDCLMEF